MVSDVRDPSVPDDIGSPTGTGVAPARLLIVSRDPLRSGVFLAALKTALSPGDDIKIIVDRRRGGSATDQPSIERRHHPAHALERVGVAIVPTRAAQLSARSIPAALPIERLDPRDADEHELKRILEYKRRRKVRLRRRVILTGMMVVIPVLLVLLPPVKTLMSRARPAAPPPSDDRMNPPSAVAPVPQVAAETPSSTPSSAPITTTQAAARIRRTPRAVDTSASAPPRAERREPPRVTQDQATAPERQWNDADDPRTVIDWLLNR
jgi:hypothetical protein